MKNQSGSHHEQHEPNKKKHDPVHLDESSGWDSSKVGICMCEDGHLGKEKKTVPLMFRHTQFSLLINVVP